ncbi:low affinity immunoglobulin gamma Fc region receptor II-like [Odontesthes bonariensis]|uniref:low affinity immunoglobulin gamma Fc region receptor II-like n=1 Tax=Odontesthes bonariensis TaxID=219752 RepID=UPI003F5823DD
MELVSTCLFIGAALLTIQPDRSQFFRYESFNLTCAPPGNFSGWTVIRNTSEPFAPCKAWGRQNGSSCINRSVYKSDTGLYWCQSEQGHCSNALHITVTTDTVILESPSLPVTEGKNVELTCSCRGRYEPTSSSNFTAKFFRNDTFIGEQPGGKMRLLGVSPSHEGFYECEHPTRGRSPQSWLAVKVKDTPPNPTNPPPKSQTRLLLSILLLLLSIVIVLMGIYVNRRRARARAEDRGRASKRLTPQR